MEVLTAAVLLLVIAMSVLSTFDVASKTSGKSKSKSIAAALAEQDQERMRALTAVNLSNYHATRTQVMGNQGSTGQGTTYTIDSRAEWIRDASGVESCTVSASQADYLRISSTVSAPLINPVKMTSLVAPPVAAFGPNQGTLAVKVTKRDAVTPATGVTVTISGPTTLSDVTNSLGCAIFSHIPVGTYTAKTSAAGYVDPNGASPGDVSGSTTVSAGNVTLANALFDVAATATVSFKTYVYSYMSAVDPAYYGAANSTPSSTAQSVTVVGPSPSSPKVVKPGGWVDKIVVPNLYPFTGGYSVYSGTCASASPTTAIPDPNYFTTTPESFATTNPGGTPTPVVRLPALSVKVTNKDGSAASGATVAATLSGTGCTGDKFTGLTTTPAGFVTHTTAKFDPGLPFGTYSVCAQMPAGGGKFWTATQTVANTTWAPRSTPLATINLPGSPSTPGAACP